MKEMLKIVLVDDNDTFRESMKFFVENKLSCKVVFSAKDGREFLQSNACMDVDLVLMDIEMPNCGGIEAVRNILWQHSDLKVIAITDYDDKAYLTQLVGAGFKGCVYKRNVDTELKTAINRVIDGKFYFPEKINM